MATVVLGAFSERDLPVVLPWFAHADQREFARDLPRRELKLRQTLPGSEYRGARVRARPSWIAEDQGGLPVAFVGAEIYDRPPFLDANGQPSTPAPTWQGPSAGLMLCVDPARWRKGYGRAALLAVAASNELAGVEWLVAGIDSRHVASQRCAAAAGFVPTSTEPDREGYVNWIRRCLS